MPQYQKDLAEVCKIPQEILLKIIEIVDEDVVIQSEITNLKKVLGEVDVDIDRVETVFYNIVLAKDDPESFIKFIDDTSKLTSSQKSILKDVMKKMHDKVDIRKIRANRHISRLKTFGHTYIQIDDHCITTEFRLFSDKDTKKIIKIVPLLVIDTAFYDSHKNKSINFQMDLDDAQLFVNALNKKIDVLKTEMQEMREKFGKDVI